MLMYLLIYRFLGMPAMRTQRIQTHPSLRHNTTSPFPTLVQAPNHSPPTPPAPPQPKHRHMSNTPPVPTGLVKPKPNSLIHSPPSPPTPLRAKHIHMSHTPPTPLTTLISSTSPVLDKTPEPRVPLIHALTATTPPPDPTPALLSSSFPHILTLSQHTYMQHKQQHMPHSHRNNRTHTIGYYDNLTNRPRTTTGLLTPHKHTDPAVKVRSISSYCKST